MENTTTLPVFDTTAPYHIKREYYRDGFAAFQKKFVMKRSYVLMWHSARSCVCRWQNK